MLVAVLLTIAFVPSSAGAAPAVGTWEGATGQGTMRFDIVRRGGQRVLTNLVRACGPHAVDRVSTGYPTSFPIGRNGRLRPVGLRSGQEVPVDGRLDGTSARVSSGFASASGGARGEYRCDFDKPFTVRRVERTVVPQTGRWVVQTPLPISSFTGPEPADATFEVTRAGSVMAFGSGDFGGPYGGRYLGIDWYCDGGYSGDLFVRRDGTFVLPATEADFRILSARFTSPTTAEGTYQTIRDGNFACDSGPQPFTAQLEGATPGQPPPPPPPPEPEDPPPTEDGCQPALKLGQVTITGACVRKEGRLYVAEGAVRVNGLDVTPEAGAKLTFDPGQLAIKATGKVTVRLGDVVLFSGPFEWSASKSFDFPAGREAKLKGLPISGTVSGSWVPDGATLKVNVSLGPDFGAITGATTLKATMADGLVLEAFSVSLAETDLRLLGRLALKTAALSYTAEQDEWVGAAEIELPGGKGVAGELAIQDGSFKRASAEVSNLNLPLGQVLYLQSIGLGVQVEPLAFSGSVGFTGGPKLHVFGRDLSALEGNGSFSWTDGDLYDTWSIGGDLSLASFSLGEANVTYRTGLDVAFSGTFGFEIVRVGFSGSAEGWIEGASAFQARATGEISLPLVGGAEAEALVSSRGLGACGTKKILFGEVSGGVSYRWSGSPHVFSGSCDFSDVEVERSDARAAQAGAPGLTLRGRRRDVVLLAVRGSGGAPRITLTGPGGLAIAAGPDGAALTDRAYLLESPDEQTTYVVVSKPAPGRYEVAPQPGSVPVTAVGKAEQLPEVRVRARVRRASGGRRVLRYAVRRIPRQRVRFVERGGGGVAHTVANTTRARGSVRFRPAMGTGGTRRIVAVVSQDGIPRAQRSVARFRVGASRAARARGVRATRRGRSGRLVVRWRHPGRVTGFDVTLTERRGRRVLRTVAPRARRVTFTGVGRRDRGRVAVVARGLGRDKARAARDTFERRR